MLAVSIVYGQGIKSNNRTTPKTTFSNNSKIFNDAFIKSVSPIVQHFEKIKKQNIVNGKKLNIFRPSFIFAENYNWKYSYSYNEAGNKTFELWEDFTVPDPQQLNHINCKSRAYFSYDPTDRLISQLNEYYEDSLWTTKSRISFCYDSYGNLTNETHDALVAGDWITDYHRLFTYDLRNNLLNESLEYYRNSVWNLSSSKTFTYDSAGNMLSYFLETDETGSMAPEHREDYSYNAANNQVIASVYEWSFGNWNFEFRKTYTYNTQSDLVMTLQEYSYLGNWVSDCRETYTYSLSGYRLGYLYEVLFGDVWEGQWRITYNNDEFGNCNFAEAESNLGAWVVDVFPIDVYYNNKSDHFNLDVRNLSVEYINITDVSDGLNTPNSFTLYQNYPNPFNPATTIKYSIPNSNMVSIKVFDILGKEVTTLVNEQQNSGLHEVTFNAEKLSSGTYFYQLKCGEFTETKKLLLLK